ncbi:hypothetical protein ACQUJT_20990, partial [Ralstonia pseudosolanacearum]
NLAQQQQLKATGLFAYPWSDFGSDIRSRELDWIKHLLIKANQGLDDASASVSRGMQNSGNPGSHVTPSDLDNLTGGGGDSGGGPSGPARAVITPGVTMCAPGVLCPTINVAPGTSGSGLPSNAIASSGGSEDGASKVADDQSLPGLNRPVRPTNSDFPPNQRVVDAMNSRDFSPMVQCEKVDCSEIAERLLNVAKGDGQILEVRPTIPRTLNVFENGKIEPNQFYHQVYTDGRYVYDPRISSRPIPKGDWEQHIRNINPGGVVISNKPQGLH